MFDKASIKFGLYHESFLKLLGEHVSNGQGMSSKTDTGFHFSQLFTVSFVTRLFSFFCLNIFGF